MGESTSHVTLQLGSQLRALDRTELVRIGEQSLRDHLMEMAIVAHQLYMPLNLTNMQQMLADDSVVRHPVRLSYELGTMAAHQFAQPEPDPQGEGYVLYLHPALEGRDNELFQAVLYFIPVLNYGKIISDEHCLVYGATVLGLTLDQYYGQLCKLAESIGVQPD